MVWKSKAIPKIKKILWTLLKGKILTAKNLQKRGINGPSRCPNYLAAEESMHHLFIDFPFAIDCWRNLSHNNQIPWNTQNTIGELPNKWKKNYPWQHRKNNTVKRVWDILPYNRLWNIWLARNRKVFNDKDSTVRSRYTKERSLALETISVKN